MSTTIPPKAKHPLEKYLIPIILLLALAIAGMTLSGSKISCGGEGKGIVDLQLAVSQETADAIKAEWQKPCPKTKCADCRLPIQFAKINVWLDFIFILIYGLFLAALNYRYNFNDRPRPYGIVSWMILFACLFDAVENTALMVFLSSEIEWDIFYLVLIPAILKFMLLVIVFVYGFRKILQTITVILKDVFRIFLILPLALISLFVLFFVIWQSDQGQDLLLTINNHEFGPVTLYIVFGCLAVMNWHFPKFFWRVSFHNRSLKYFFTHHFTYKHPKELKNIIAVPRLFGVLSFLIPACGILQVFKIFKVKFLLSWISPSALLLILTLLFHLCFRYMWLQTFREKFFKTFLAVCILLALTPFLFWGFNNSEPIDLQWLFYGFLAYAILFALLTSNRVALKDMKVFIFLSDKVITPLTWILVGLCSLAFMIFAVQNVFCVSFDWDTRPTTLAIVISGIILYYALFTILNILGKKYRIAYSGMLLVAILILSAKLKNDYHYVSQVAVTSKAKTITLHDYAARWLRHRDNNYTGDSVYKIYLVNTYGGGIRASAWTCMTVNRLDSLQYLATGEAFQDHVFSYSGASGGTIGAAILCANRYYHKDGVKTNDYINFFSKDYLTHVLVGNLGNDAWYATTGIHGSDRSEVQESIWEKHYADSFGGRLDIAFDDVWLNDTGYRVPLLFSNTTDYKNGRKGIYAPVQLYHNDFPGSTLVRNII
ncbi:MAG TPA: hypothetical protein VEB40_03830, partial [Flavipsychrobacter sp.]|nr:hypothetical protein [Flavipsychrobacter sp.]